MSIKTFMPIIHRLRDISEFIFENGRYHICSRISLFKNETTFAHATVSTKNEEVSFIKFTFGDIEITSLPLHQTIDNTISLCFYETVEDHEFSDVMFVETKNSIFSHYTLYISGIYNGKVSLLDSFIPYEEVTEEYLFQMSTLHEFGITYEDLPYIKEISSTLGKLIESCTFTNHTINVSKPLDMDGLYDIIDKIEDKFKFKDNFIDEE